MGPTAGRRLPARFRPEKSGCGSGGPCSKAESDQFRVSSMSTPWWYARGMLLRSFFFGIVGASGRSSTARASKSSRFPSRGGLNFGRTVEIRSPR